MPRPLTVIGMIVAIIILVPTLCFMNRPRVVYYMIPTLIDEWQTESQKAIEQFFREKKYTVISIDARNDQELQNLQLGLAIDLWPAAIILYAVDAEKIDTELIKAAKNRGIKFLNYDRAIPGVEVDFTSITDARGTGEKAAEAAVELLRNKYIMIDRFREVVVSVDLLQIMGDPGDSWSGEVQNGFVQTMKEKARTVNIISRPAMKWDPENARKIAMAAIKDNPEIDLVYTHAADLMVPIIDVLKTKRKKPGDVILISSNGAPAGLKNIKDPPHWQQVEIEQPVYAQAYGLLLYIEDKLHPPCDLFEALGVSGVLKRDERGGLVLKLSGQKIELADLTRPDGTADRYWGNLVPPKTFEYYCYAP